MSFLSYMRPLPWWQENALISHRKSPSTLWPLLKYHNNTSRQSMLLTQQHNETSQLCCRPPCGWDTKQDCPSWSRMTIGHDFLTHVIRKLCHHGLDERRQPGKSPLGNVDHPQFKTPTRRINDRASIKTLGQQKLYNVCI